MDRKIVLLFLLLIVCGKEKKDNYKFPENPPDEIINNFSMIELDRDRKVYSIKSKKAYLYDEKSLFIVFKPEINFYGEKGEIIAQVNTDTGIIYNRTGKFYARGHVVLKTSDSTILHTDSLLWDNERRLIITDAPVEVYTPTGRIRAIGMESDAFLRRIVFRKKIEGETNMVEEE